MRCCFFKRLAVLLPFFALVLSATAQTDEEALAYNQTLIKPLSPVRQNSWAYIRTVSHSGSSPNQSNERLKQLLTSIEDARIKVKTTPPFKGDATFRDSILSYLTLCYDLMNTEYSKLYGLQIKSLESFAAMQAYINATDLANEHLKKSVSFLQSEQQKFADKYHFKLLATEQQTEDNIKTAVRVWGYHNHIFLIFFKCDKQESMLIHALDSAKVSSINQNKAVLQKYAEEGLTRLDTFSAYNNDTTLIHACKNMLQFYLIETKEKIPTLMDYFNKREKFNRVKAAFDAIAEKDRTQPQIDGYNKALEELNATINAYNTNNEDLNQKRSQYFDEWKAVSSTFVDKHVAK